MKVTMIFAAALANHANTKWASTGTARPLSASSVQITTSENQNHNEMGGPDGRHGILIDGTESSNRKFIFPQKTITIKISHLYDRLPRGVNQSINKNLYSASYREWK